MYLYLRLIQRNAFELNSELEFPIRSLIHRSMTLQRMAVSVKTEFCSKLIPASATIVCVVIIWFGSNGAFGSLTDSIQKAEKRRRGSKFICAVAVAPASGCVQIESEHAIPALAVFVSFHSAFSFALLGKLGFRTESIYRVCWCQRAY